MTDLSGILPSKKVIPDYERGAPYGYNQALEDVTEALKKANVVVCPDEDVLTDILQRHGNLSYSFQAKAIREILMGDSK